MDRDRVEAVGILLSGPEAGTEVAGALSLPDGGRDPVRHRGYPEGGTDGQSLRLTDGDRVKTAGKQSDHVWKHDAFSRRVKPEGAEETFHVSIGYTADLQEVFCLFQRLGLVLVSCFITLFIFFPVPRPLTSISTATD